MTDSILLCSGGLDSTVLSYQLLREKTDFIPVFINYGQHCAAVELETAKAVLPSQVLAALEVLDISDVYKRSESRLMRAANLWDVSVKPDDLYVPYRNLLLFTVGAAFAVTVGAHRVFTAVINSFRAKEIDCSVEFFSKLRGVMDVYGDVELVMPFRDMSKTEVARLGAVLGAPLGQTFSCQAAAEMPCGACPNCVERLNALSSIGESK